MQPDARRFDSMAQLNIAYLQHLEDKLMSRERASTAAPDECAQHFPGRVPIHAYGNRQEPRAILQSLKRKSIDLVSITSTTKKPA